MQVINVVIRLFTYGIVSIVAAILLTFLLSSCNTHASTVEISGTIKGAPNSLVLFREAADNSVYVIDSCRTDKDGNFSLEHNINTPTFLLVQLQGKVEPIVLLVSPSEQIRLDANAEDFAHSYMVRGSHGSQAVRELNSKLNRVISQIDTLTHIFLTNREKPNFAPIKDSVDNVYNQILNEHREFTINFIKRNRYNLASVLALYQEYDAKRSVLNKRDDLELFQLVDSSLYPLYPDNRLVANLRTNVRKLSKQFELMDRKESMLNVGQSIQIQEWPIFPEGSLSLNDIKARYTLIYFWASWCKDCLPHNATLKELHQEFSERGLDIIQVSLDENPDALQRVIEADSLTWTHVCDFKDWDSPIADQLKLSSIPANYLIDRNGVIRGSDLPFNELFELLERLLP